MPAHVGWPVLALASLLTASIPTAYSLGAAGSARSEAQTPDLAPPPAPGEARLERSADGFFYAPAELDGHRLRLLVDTGASAIMLSTGDARRLGIDPRGLVFDRHVQTSAGVVPMARVTLDRLTIAGRSFEDVPVMVLAHGGGVPLMGQSIIARFHAMRMSGDLLILN